MLYWCLGVLIRIVCSRFPGGMSQRVCHCCGILDRWFGYACNCTLLTLYHIHYKVRTFRKLFLVLFVRLRFVLFQLHDLGRGGVWVLWSWCLGICVVIFFCFCGSIGSCIVCVFLVLRIVCILRCSIFVCCVFVQMVFRSRHISFQGI